MSYWFFPSNKDVFDMVSCLHEHNYIDQPCYRPVKVGDTVFIYVTVPYGQILYQMEVIATFASFDQINQGRWAKYSKNHDKRDGAWIRLQFVDHANPGFKPLQPQGLRENDINTSNMIYKLTIAKAEYILEQFKASKE